METDSYVSCCGINVHGDMDCGVEKKLQEIKEFHINGILFRHNIFS